MNRRKPVAAIIDERNGTFTVLKCDGEAATKGKTENRPILGRRKVATFSEALFQAGRVEWKYW